MTRDELVEWATNNGFVRTGDDLVCRWDGMEAKIAFTRFGARGSISAGGEERTMANARSLKRIEFDDAGMPGGLGLGMSLAGSLRESGTEPPPWYPEELAAFVRGSDPENAIAEQPSP